MAELHWFPAYVGEWLGSRAISMMLPEQEGAYWRLLNLAWGNGESEPSLPSDDEALARMSRLGARWKRLGGLVRAQFQERDGKLYNAKLSEVWREAQAKHDSAVSNGRNGGRKKAANRKQKASPPTDSLAETGGKSLAEPYQLQSQLQGAVDKSSKELCLPAPAPGGALSAEAPRLPGAVDVRNPCTAPAPLADVLDSFAGDWRDALRKTGGLHQ